jgi:dGTPase
LVKGNIQTEKYNALPNKKSRVSYLRALAIGTLIDEAVALFVRHEEALLNGSFEFSLLDKSPYKAQMDDIIKLSIDRIYNSKEVIDKEISGFEVINELLLRFVTAVNNCYEDQGSHYDELLLKMLPSEFDFTQPSLYNRLMGVCAVIASYSDSKAVLTYKKLKGLKF